jgi:alkyl hydroperoxide reductase 1
MSELKAGDSFPEEVYFTYVPPAGDLNVTACGIPVKYDASKGMCDSQNGQP